jgi:hypothetical protein
MAITLGGITLPDLIIDNEVAWSGIQGEVNRALDGSLIIWEQEVAGELINLVGRSDTAWITRTALLQIQALAQVAKATYVLSYEGVESDVRFRQEEGNVISAFPVVERPNPASDDWYSDVVIKLMYV